MQTTWQITKLEIIDSPLNGIVVRADYRVAAEDIGTYVESVGQVSFNYTDGQSFIPYSELTEQQVIGWVQSTLGQNRLQEIDIGLTRLIAEKKEREAVKVIGLPWTVEPAPVIDTANSDQITI